MKKLLVVSLVLALSLVLASSVVMAGAKAKAKASDCDISLPKFVTLLPTPKWLPCKMPKECPIDIVVSEFASILTIEPLAKGNCAGVCPVDLCNPCAPCVSWSAKWVCGIIKECGYWRPVPQKWFCFPQKFAPGGGDITIVAEEQED